MDAGMDHCTISQALNETNGDNGDVSDAGIIVED